MEEASPWVDLGGLLTDPAPEAGRQQESREARASLSELGVVQNKEVFVLNDPLS